MSNYDVCIIGGGAAGLAAAATLKDNYRVCILEKNTVPGKKILASGGGRCNITNASAEGLEETVEFFRGLGLELYCDAEGRYYPYSNQSSDVVALLLASINNKNTKINTGFSAGSIRTEGGKFCISDGSREITADKVILAAGGKSYPNLGTTGDGYSMARSLGHQVNRVYPVLAPVECENMPSLKGIRAKGVATLLKDGKPVDSEAGEIQFTEDGVSGICIFNLTMSIKAEEGEKPLEAMKRYEISLDLAPDFTQEEVAARTSSMGIVTERLAQVIKPADLKDYRLKVKGTKGWKQAQCTAGGVDLSQVNMDTMESLLIPGLYITGEVLDVQHKCGGFNLQNAWLTGIKAARHINGI
ncbi:MAG: NAD(P)/FAD-dependent oxidoreductase [Eubacterium sp.]|nr:NAD(P)/FAD-dependent oxidoreductase [Candidatus Colimonas fimequi]